MTGRAILLRSNALDLPLADESVDLIVTSPPYFALRSYQDGGEHYDGQIGAEATPGEFVDALIAATREMMRVLKSSGSIFVNLGDKYAGSAGGGGMSAQSTLDGSKRTTTQTGGPRLIRTQVRPKSLIGVPWRYALRCIDDLGLILRAEIIWVKPNGLPESVTDRVSRKHEQWFHFTKQERYYANIDTIREAQASHNASHFAKYGAASQHYNNKYSEARRDSHPGMKPAHPLGKIPGSWWNIPTQGLRVPPELGVDHFAAFPIEWPRRLILGWSPSGICVECGQGRRATTERTFTGDYNHDEATRQQTRVATMSGGTEKVTLGRTANIDRRVTGEACACVTPDAPTRPAVVLDPFGGTGTTAAVAKALGRTGISVDLSADYLRLADWRCNRDGYEKIHAKIHPTIKRTRAVPKQAETLFGGEA